MKHNRIGRYVKTVDNFPEPGKHLLFNTLTHGFVEIDDATRKYLESEGEAERNGIRNQNIRKLRRMGFLKESPRTEEKQIEHYYRELRSDMASTLQATVLTTFDCNFACTYCVEDGVIKPVYMTEKEARDTAEFIISKAKAAKVPSIYLIFYGGEPLLNPDAIRIVAAQVGDFARKTRKSFSFSLVTNGALLTPEIVDELIEFGLDGAKVTIDGSPSCHNAKRPFRNGSGSFDAIMQNVELVADRIRLDIGGNFDDENVDSISELLDILEARGLKRKINKISFKPISDTPEDRKTVARHSELECVYAREDTKHSTVRLRNMLIDRGFPTDPGIGVTICGATFGDTHFTIDPAGKLYKCPAFVGREEFSVGTIYDRHIEQTPKELWRRCAKCENVAMCGDGCMFGAYMRFGDQYKLNCQKEYMNDVVQENLKTWYKELTAYETASELDSVS